MTETKTGTAQNGTRYDAPAPFNRPEFAKAHPQRDNWDNAAQKSGSERGVMVALFHAWLVRTRIETEQRLIGGEHHMRDVAPFAQACLTESDKPSDLPFVVSEFCQAALDVLELKRKLNLLNVYYRQAVNDESDQNLIIEAGNEADVNRLWEWFLSERNESETE